MDRIENKIKLNQKCNYWQYKQLTVQRPDTEDHRLRI